MAAPRLHIARDLTLPLEAVTQTFSFLAKRGAGKTYSAGVLVEEMLRAKQQVLVVDPLDVWWGLRAAADGKGPGLPITVLGGPHGDLPLEEGDAETIARFVIEHGVSVVLSLRHLRKQARTRFLTPFYETLYHLAGQVKRPIHLAVDEADASAPQKPMKGEERMLGAMEDIVRRGRSDGLGCSLISQRSAVLNKDVLTQTEVLVALRTIAPQDMAAIDAWISQHGDDEHRRAMMESLPSLPIGDSWWWSPGWLDVFMRTRVREKLTFDSSRTPKIGERVKAPKQLAAVDLEALRAQLAKTVEKARADDPAVLRKRIAQLEAEAKKAANSSPPRPTKGVEKQADPAAIDRAVRKALGDAERQVMTYEKERDKRLAVQLVTLERIGKSITDSGRMVGEYVQALRDIRDMPRPIIGVVSNGNGHAQAVPAHQSPRATTPAPAPRAPRVAASAPLGAGDSDLARSDRKILNTLALMEQLRIPGERTNLAFLSGYAVAGRFNNLVGGLRTRGLVDYPREGEVGLTDEGRAVADAGDVHLHSVDDLHALWLAKLSASEGRVLQALLEAYPEPLAREELASRTNYEVAGRFNNIVGRLRSLGAVDYPSTGLVAATDIMFPEGL